MTKPRIRPAFVADETTQLLGWLEVQRAVVRWKCGGLSEEDVRAAPVGSSPDMTLAGLVQHLRWTEHCWFQVMFLNREQAENPQFDESGPEDADWAPGDTSVAELLAAYKAECRRSDETIRAHSLDEQATNPFYTDGAPTLRWILIHMVEETARHAGHADLVRELVDKSKGYYP